MKVKILMATLAITLMLGVQGFANPCACVDPCGATCVKGGGNLFSGLQRLVNGVRIANNCDPCDPVVACNPCDEVTCDPCDAVCSTPRFGLGGRLRNLIAGPSQCSPCDGAGNCFDRNCSPCDSIIDCDPCSGSDFCGPQRFSLRNLNPFKGFRLNRGCATDCDPCDSAANCFDGCDPCDGAANCFDGCGDSCGPRGHLFDLPRFNLSKLFSSLRRCNAGDCGPCDSVQPCEGVCCR